jgi:hypothetical protein
MFVGGSDGMDSSQAAEDRIHGTSTVWSRTIRLHLSLINEAGWASIENGAPGDDLWLERRTGSSIETLGKTSVPAGWAGWRTLMYATGGISVSEPVIRACGKAGGHNEIACTEWYSSRLCYKGKCDLSDPSLAISDDIRQVVVDADGRSISLRASNRDQMVWASIDHGNPGDAVWLDRNVNRGQGNWKGLIGFTNIPVGSTAWRTQMIVSGSCGNDELVVRACGGAGPVCTGWFTSGMCFVGGSDGKDPADAEEDRGAATANVWWRSIKLHLSLSNQAGWASIENGSPGDQTWIERRPGSSGGATEVLGTTSIPSGNRGWRTLMYKMGDPTATGPQLRACGKAGDREEVACTDWYSSKLCYNGKCDAVDASFASDDVLVDTVLSGSAVVALHESPLDRMGWASIHSGKAGDAVWIDRSVSGAKNWAGLLAYTTIPVGGDSRRTAMFVIGSEAEDEMIQIRACGASSGHAAKCTEWHPVNGISTRRLGRKLQVRTMKSNRTAWAVIENGAEKDEIWLDRSWDNGLTWEGLLGKTVIANGATKATTTDTSYYNQATGAVGVVRACAAILGTITCTPWFPRTNDELTTLHTRAANELSNHLSDSIYQGSTTWGDARALHALIDYTGATGDCTYWGRVQEYYENRTYSDFQNDFYDDTGWWGLAWARAAELASRCNDSGNYTNYVILAARIWSYIRDNGWISNPNTASGEYTSDDIFLKGGGVRWRQCHDPVTISTAIFMSLSSELSGLHVPGLPKEAFRYWANRVAGKPMGNVHPWFEDFDNETTYSHRRLNCNGLIMDSFGIFAVDEPVDKPGEELPKNQCAGNDWADSTDQPDRIEFSYSDALDTCCLGLPQRYFAQDCVPYVDPVTRQSDISDLAYTYNQGMVIRAYARMAEFQDATEYLSHADEYGYKSMAYFVTNIPELGEVINDRGAFQDGTLFKGVLVNGLRKLREQDRLHGRSFEELSSFLVTQRNAVIAKSHSADRGFEMYGDSWIGNSEGFSIGTQTCAVDALNAAAGL